MSLRQLVEPECGGENPLMRLGGHVIRDSAYKDEGFPRQIGAPFSTSTDIEENKYVNEYLTQFAQPQSFNMDNLLQEMREIDAQNFHPPVVNAAPMVIEEVNKSANWASEFASERTLGNDIQSNSDTSKIWDKIPVSTQGEQSSSKHVVWLKDFFGQNEAALADYQKEAEIFDGINSDEIEIVGINCDEFVEIAKNFESSTSENKTDLDDYKYPDDWVEDFETYKTKAADITDPNSETSKSSEYNRKFWDKLQEEWKKISEETTGDHPWLTEFSDYYDPYKEYNFTENNPMLEDKDALEKGKAFLAQGDIPSAVLCFESAAKQDPKNAEAWELLGISQAENEMDPNAIVALKHALELNPGNMKVLMSLAVSYTNESLQSQALRMLTKWLQCNPKYKHLIPETLATDNEAGVVASSLIRGPELVETQNIFLKAVKQNPNEIDSDVQEALGVLFNLSSEYDKAADCFRAALHVSPDNAKIWNRLGASLANGNRAVEAVDAYQRALNLEPGFIRARYNVGIICMHMKAYKEAAGHLLTALNLQASSASRSGLKTLNLDNSTQISDTIWSTFRMIVSLMGRRDLQEVMDRRDLNALNQAFSDS